MNNIRKQWLQWTGIDRSCYFQIFKGAIAPTIALACGQSTAWLQIFGTLGYLVPFAVIICYPMQPRGVFLQSLFLSTATVCVTAALTLLAMFCIVNAREDASAYDSSASAMAALWLVVLTLIISAVRARYESMVWPSAAALVFSNYGMVFATEFVDMQQAVAFVRELLLAHLVGFALSLGVSLLLFPTTCGQSFSEALVRCAHSAMSCLEANSSLRKVVVAKNVEGIVKEISRVRQRTAALATLQVKLLGAASPAIREISIHGRKTQELTEMNQKMWDVLSPLTGMKRLADTAERAVLQPAGVEKASEISLDHLSRLIEATEAAFDLACNAASAGIKTAMQHPYFSETNGICKRGPCNQTTASYDACIANIHSSLNQLTNGKRALVSVHSRMPYNTPQNLLVDMQAERNEMFAVLHGEFLIWTTTQRVLELLQFVQARTAYRSDGFPYRDELSSSWTMLQDAIRRCLRFPRTPSDLAGIPQAINPQTIADGTRQSKRSTTIASWMRYGMSHCNLQFFASPPAGFALRVTTAVMSIAVGAFLQRTQSFYIKQHLLWAQYTVAFGMQTSNGQSLRHFLLRFGGTALAVVMALVSFYIVGGHPAGAIVSFFLCMHIPIYIMVKHPRVQATGSVSAFTLTIVLGDILQLQKIGPSQAEALGLAVHPAWLVGLVRLASIGGGLLLATIWTILPYPISEQQQVRRTAAICLNSTARYYSSTLMTTRSHTRARSSLELKRAVKNAHKSRRCRSHEAVHIDRQLASMSTQLSLAKWDVQIGGHFPQAQYERMRNALGALVRNIDLVRLATTVFAESVETEENLATSAWLRNFRCVLEGAEETSNQTTTLLMVLANSMNTATPLPPFLRVPDPFLLSDFLDRIDRDVLHVRNVSEPGLATFAAMQIEIQDIHRHLEEVLTVVREVVGQLDIAPWSQESMSV